MSKLTTPAPIIRSHEDSEQRWFFGGGVHTWLATEEETGGAFLLFEIAMDRGKVTPCIRIPIPTKRCMCSKAKLSCTWMATNDPLARVVSPSLPAECRTPSWSSPNQPDSCACTRRLLPSFYMDASVPLAAGQPVSGEVDFNKIMASGQKNGGIEILGPPPFAQP